MVAGVGFCVLSYRSACQLHFGEMVGGSGHGGRFSASLEQFEPVGGADLLLFKSSGLPAACRRLSEHMARILATCDAQQGVAQGVQGFSGDRNRGR